MHVIDKTNLSEVMVENAISTIYSSELSVEHVEKLFKHAVYGIRSLDEIRLTRYI